MPAPPRPSGAIPPADLLWRFELQQNNAALLERMRALETKVKQQEARTTKAEEAAARCTATADGIEQANTAIDQLEARQQEFVDTSYKRLVSMDKDIGEFQKTQERVQKVVLSLRELDRAVGDLSLLSTRLDEVEMEVRSTRDDAGQRCAQELGKLETRLQTLELERSRGESAVSSLRDDVVRTIDERIQSIRVEVASLRGSTAPAESPGYVQVPRSPEMRARSTTTAPPTANPSNHITAFERRCHQLQDQTQIVHRETRPRQGTTQATTQEEDLEDFDLDLPMIPEASPRKPAAYPSELSPRKKPRLSAQKPQRSDGRPQLSKSSAIACKSTNAPKATNVSSPEVFAPPIPATAPKSTAGPRSVPASNSNTASKLAASRKSTAVPKSGLASGQTAALKPSKVVVLPLPKATRKPERPSSDTQSDNEVAPPVKQKSRGKKRPGSPISAPQPDHEGRSHPTTVPQSRESQAGAKKRKGKKPTLTQPSQPARTSRRRAEQVSMYELDWKEQLRSQPKSGPAFHETVATRHRRRRLPPVPEEQYEQ